MLILSTQPFSFPQNAKNMKEKEGNILLHIPFRFGRQNLSNFEKEKKIKKFGLHFHLDYFRGKGDVQFFLQAFVLHFHQVLQTCCHLMLNSYNIGMLVYE